jgi:thymidine phosphorylase
MAGFDLRQLRYRFHKNPSVGFICPRFYRYPRQHLIPDELMENPNRLQVIRLAIDTHHQAIAFMRRDCYICRSEGFNAQSRVELSLRERRVVVTLDIVDGDWLQPQTIGVSEFAWKLLDAQPGDNVSIAHPQPLESLSWVRAKIFGRTLDRKALNAVMDDIVNGRYSDVHVAAFVTACAGNRMDLDEITWLTDAMVNVGEKLQWGRDRVLDKHCIGGLPGNRTTPLVVAIAASHGLCIPKTSSRAITSPAGTADTMEMLAPVTLDLPTIKRVVEQTGGCIAWGGFVNLSPADDMLIRIERALELDNEGQLVASVLSKKVAAGATHVVIDIPVGPTAKVRSIAAAESLSNTLTTVGSRLGLHVRTLITDGSQPVGRGIGPALEANDLLAVFQNRPDAPDDLRQRALDLAGSILELGGVAALGSGRQLAATTLQSGAAWHKFQAICTAQGGLRVPPVAPHQREITAVRDGCVHAVDNRMLSRLAKLAGAPASPAAGLCVAVHVGQWVHRGEPLFSLHAETPGELAYALDYYHTHADIFSLTDELP